MFTEQGIINKSPLSKQKHYSSVVRQISKLGCSLLLRVYVCARQRSISGGIQALTNFELYLYSFPSYKENDRRHGHKKWTAVFVKNFLPQAQTRGRRNSSSQSCSEHSEPAFRQRLIVFLIHFWGFSPIVGFGSSSGSLFLSSLFSSFL